MSIVKLKDLVYKPITGEWGKEESENPLRDGVVNLIRTANFLSTGQLDYSNITQRAILKKKKIENGEVWVADVNKIESKQLENKDLIIEKSGGGPKTPVGRVVIFEAEKNKTYLCSNFLSVLRPKQDIVIPEFLLYQFKYLYQINIVKKYQNQTTGLYNLKIDKYLNVEINLPSISEQSIIVAQLTKIQELINIRTKTIDLLDEYIRSVFFEIFGDTVLDTKKIGKKPLSFFGEWGSGGTPTRKEKKYFQGNIPWFTSGELNSIFLKSSKEKITKEAIKNSSAKYIEKGSLLVGMVDTASLKLGITIEKASCNQNIVFSKLDKNLCRTEFIYYSIHLSRDYYLKQRTGVRQKNLSASKIKKIEILFPKLSLQNKFVGVFEKVQIQKQKYRESLDLLETLFQTTLQNAFDLDLEVDEEIIFEDILQNLTVNDLKKGKRIEYLLNLLKKDKKKENFSNFANYNLALEKLLLLIEDGSIEQYLERGNIKLKKSL
ncbi:restriction endonuclease subunit S [Lacinutrix sp. MEBiC02595]